MSILSPLVKAAEAVNKLNANYTSISYEELKAMTFMQRVRAYNWTFELGAVAVLGLVLVFYLVGTKLNTSRAEKLFDSVSQCFHDLAFARVGFSTKSGDKKKYISEHNNTWFTTFTTGRSTIKYITVRSHMYARFNPMAMITERVLGVFFPSLIERDLQEYVEVVVAPNGIYVPNELAEVPANANEALSKFKFIASIVNKGDMGKAREQNYFLSLTHTAESENLPLQYVFMSENNQLNGFFSRYGGAEFRTLLEKCANILSYISFTDLPDEKPITDKLWNENQEPRCVIRCKLSTNSRDLTNLNELIKSVVGIYDSVTQEFLETPASAFITNDMLKKSYNLRTQELQKIQKVMKQVERELAMEKKQKLEKEKRRELRNKLSGEEQDKLDRKMKEKRERRMRNRQKTRM
ncbi:LAFE_0C02036g1_1 [Lachancea fermentati]|uniref:LAFE_0C02036g1_1 n=1 Tax=Lachancea fermentati TaxID=4955 RepID=A0A1G4M942_LACFM|nr:LAFE_0C02036g1_1 [Lachancea fermentati]